VVTSTAEEARAAVTGRLRELMTGHAAQPALHAGPRTWSWGDVGVVAHAIEGQLARVDLPARSPVGVVLRQRPETVAAQLAILATGREAVVVSPLAADAALADDVRRVAPAVLVAHVDDWERPGLTTAARAGGTVGIAIDGAGRVEARPGGRHPGPGCRPGAGALTVLTSGTTGAPKRLPVSWETFIRLGGGAPGAEPSSKPGAVILSVPLVTLGGLLSLARLVFGGRPPAMMERFDVREWAELVHRYRPRVMGAPPPVVKMILDAGITPDRFDGVTVCVTSSGPVPPEVARAFEDRYAIPVLVGYGATEFLGPVSGWTAELYARYGHT
jgi:long-chain acyl-CoA synthetase